MMTAPRGIIDHIPPEMGTTALPFTMAKTYYLAFCELAMSGQNVNQFFRSRKMPGKMIGKENVIRAMEQGARLFAGGYASCNRLQFADGSMQYVHTNTINALFQARLIKSKNNEHLSPIATEQILHQSDLA